MRFYSKVLLFGEHIVNKGAKALAIPYSAFYCQLTFEETNTFILPESKSILLTIYNQIETSSELASIFNLNSFKSDIDAGLNIEMNIPIGYGLGSSGALVACIYEKYCVQKTTNIDLLKNQLGEIESVFHGKSSGLDPLVSYLNKPVLIEEKTTIVDLPNNWKSNFEVYLIDTNKPRKTAPLVNNFLKLCQDNVGFNAVVLNEIIPLNNQIIDKILVGDKANLYLDIQKLSQLQIEKFTPLILPQHTEIWKNGIAKNQFFLKICGAGGGGFMLAFTQNKANLISIFDDVNVIEI